MTRQFDSLIDRVAHRRALRRWSNAGRAASNIDLATLRMLRNRARQLRVRVDQLIHTADSRLMLPLLGTNAIQKPLNSDWSYRPELWRGPVSPPGIPAAASKSMLGSETTVFHDCNISELTLRQLRNTHEEDLAPYGLRMDLFRFDGSFLSLVLDLPDEAVHGLKKRHLIRMDVRVELEKPLEIFARLNVKHGPNTEQIVRELPLQEEQVFVEFDLAYSKLNEKRVERMWIDLIFGEPEMNQIFLRDVTLCRHPRAEL